MPRSFDPTRAVDMHAHVFAAEPPAVAGARYVPGYAADVADYLALLDAHDVGAGLLVQPSFLGEDNSALLAAVRRSPERLRAVLVVDPARGCADVAADLVSGVRLNLVGRAVPDLGGPAWRRLGRCLARHDRHLEVQARGEQWPALGPALARWPSAVVLDHVGLPCGNAAADAAVVELAHRPHVWVKLSAPYRSDPGAARELADRIVARAGVDRLVWGSDWPWTNHERDSDYRSCLDWLTTLLDADAAATVLTVNPHRLLGT